MVAICRFDHVGFDEAAATSALFNSRIVDVGDDTVGAAAFHRGSLLEKPTGRSAAFFALYFQKYHKVSREKMNTEC